MDLAGKLPSMQELSELLSSYDPPLILPNPQKKTVVSMSQLVKLPLEAIGGYDNILGIIAFGSAVREPQKVKRRFLFWKWDKIVHPKPNDVDVMFLIANPVEKLYSQAVLQRTVKHKGDYGEHWESVIKTDLHTFACTPETFQMAHDDGATETRAIMKDGVLIAGEFVEDFSLSSPMKARWLRQGRSPSANYYCEVSMSNQ